MCCVAFGTNGKFTFFRHPKIWAHYSLNIMCLNIRTPTNYHFLSGTNGKVVVLGVCISSFLAYKADQNENVGSTLYSLQIKAVPRSSVYWTLNDVFS